MNLAIDIGNTFTHFGLYKGGKLVRTFNIPTHSKLQLSSFHNKYIIRTADKIEQIGISCVVPKQIQIWLDYIKKYFGIYPLTINNKNKLPVSLKVKNSVTLGADRICLAAYGYSKFKDNVIVCGFGTANTYNIVLKNGNFIGGIIAPGINTSAKALNNNTGKLPKLNFKDLKFSRSVIGSNTKSAIRSGLLNYPLFATEGIIKAIEKQYRCKFKVVITGGSAKIFKNKFSFKAHYNDNAVLDGINMILEYQNK